MRKLIFILGLIVLVLPSISLGAQENSFDPIPRVPRAVLMDFQSGRILFQKAQDEPQPPASLTKLMTMHLVMQAIEEKKISWDQLVPITKKSEARAMPWGSSLMFLEAGQVVTVRELMTGLAVDSGNDAGLTLAIFLGGDEKTFVGQMNDEARKLGLAQTIFFDSYGYDNRNRITALEFAQFCRIYLLAHPYALGFHSQRIFDFPTAQNWGPDHHGRIRTLVQKNRNSLLDDYPGADGFKTGYIDESGYNLAATAKKGNQRLIAVLLGIKAKNGYLGAKTRTQGAVALLDLGFDNYPLRVLPAPKLPPLKAWHVKNGTVAIQMKQQVEYPLAKFEEKRVKYRLEKASSVIGPFLAGRTVGTIVWSLDGQDIGKTAIVTRDNGEAADWFTQCWQSVYLFFRGLLGKAPALDLSK